jgi:hypothetical protein
MTVDPDIADEDDCRIYSSTFCRFLGRMESCSVDRIEGWGWSSAEYILEMMFREHMELDIVLLLVLLQSSAGLESALRLPRAGTLPAALVSTAWGSHEEDGLHRQEVPPRGDLVDVEVVLGRYGLLLVPLDHPSYVVADLVASWLPAAALLE